MAVNPFETTRNKNQGDFSNRSVTDLFAKIEPGFSQSTGIHIYSELRPTERLRIADDDYAAQKFLRVIELYVQAALASSGIQYGSALGRYQIRLFEVQSNVLHLHLEAEKNTSSILAALQFAFAFTKVVYEAIAADMEDSWNGFAICMDHGRAILLRHGSDCSSSLISLGPSANRPAKRLIHGKTPAGTVEVPGDWAPLLGLPKTNQLWLPINLRDREKLPFFEELGLEHLEGILKARVDEAFTQMAARRRRQDEIRETHHEIEQGRFSPGQPYRTQAFVMTADFDNFSPLVEEAFKRDGRAIENLARGFYSLLQFGDFYEQSTPGAIRLPWAGDRATFVFEETQDIVRIRGGGWINWVEKWQTFAGATEEGQKADWRGIFPNVEWAVGTSRGDDGHCLLAVIDGGDRQFLIGAGWPLATSLTAQNLGRGGEVTIPSTDYGALFPAPKSFFAKHREDPSFWSSLYPSQAKIENAAVGAGAKVAAPITFAEKAATIQVPSPRPWSRL